jgi:hypothetical protein
MKKILVHIINGIGSLLDISGEYEEDQNIRIEAKKGPLTDYENIQHDFEKVGDYIEKSLNHHASKGQISMEFQGNEPEKPKSLSY